MLSLTIRHVATGDADAAVFRHATLITIDFRCLCRAITPCCRRRHAYALIACYATPLDYAIAVISPLRRHAAAECAYACFA